MNVFAKFWPLFLSLFIFIGYFFLWSYSQLPRPASPQHPVTHLSDSCPPFHHQFVPNVKPTSGKRLKILFLSHAFNYEVGMDRGVFIHYEALKKHPWIEPTLWGMGFPDWDFKRTIKENLLARYGEIYFDVLYLYGMAHNYQVKEISGEIIVVIREHECWDRRCVPYIVNNNATLVMLAYAHEILMYIEESYNALIVHSPHTTDQDIFYHPVAAKRNHDVVLVGNAHPLVYPLRSRFKDMIQAGKIPGGALRKHPGYFSKEWRDDFWYSYDLNMTNVRIMQHQVVEYADFIKDSKICLMDSSAYKYALQKYVEFPMAGCLMVGDLPLDQREEFEMAMVEVTNDMSDEQIVKTIQYWLDNEELRLEKAKLAQQIAMQYTVKKWGDQVIKSVNRLKKEGYGIIFDRGFEIGCAATSLPAGKLTNQYCKLNPNKPP